MHRLNGQTNNLKMEYKKKPLTIEIARVVLVDKNKPITSKNSPVNRLHSLLKKSPKTSASALSQTHSKSVNSSWVFPRSASKVSVFGPVENRSPDEAKKTIGDKRKANTDPRNRAKTATKNKGGFSFAINGSRNNFKTGALSINNRIKQNTLKQKMQEIVRKVQAEILGKEQKALNMIGKREEELATLEKKFRQLQQIIQRKVTVKKNLNYV